MIFPASLGKIQPVIDKAENGDKSDLIKITDIAENRNKLQQKRWRQQKGQSQDIKYDYLDYPFVTARKSYELWGLCRWNSFWKPCAFENIHDF